MGDFQSMFEKNILNLGLARLENYGTVRYGQGDKFGRNTVLVYLKKYSHKKRIEYFSFVLFSK